jgi:hypothetical protein
MKRRSFLSLLGLAPAAPLIAREMAKAFPAPQPTDLPKTYVSYAPESQDWSECTLGVGDAFQPIECRDVTLSCSGAIAWPDVFSQQTGGKR